MPEGVTVKLTAQPQRLIETAPYNPNSKMSSNLLNTDKVALKTEENNLKLEKQPSRGKHTGKFFLFLTFIPK